MAQLKCENLRELLKQSKYVPQKQRLIQLNACETLIRIIRPQTEYPWEFVCFHITGYRPRNYVLQDSYSYTNLVHDLPIFAAELSWDMEIPATQFKGKKAYTVETLAQRFGVCQKTINRWRNDGLIGRYMRLDNGRKRLVFLAAGVDHYIKNHQDQVRRGRQFSQIDPHERRKIIHTLEKFSRFCPDRRSEAIKRTARRYQRSNESIRKILSDHEQLTVKTRLFEKRPDFIKADQRAQIADLFAQGISVKELMARFSRSKSNIYRALNIHWAQLLNLSRIEYIPSHEFSDPSIKMKTLSVPDDLFESHELLKSTPNDPDSVVGEDKVSGKQREKPVDDMESYWQDIHAGQLLTQRQEAFLFRKYNYLKYLTDELRRNINLKNPRGTQIRQAQQYLRQAEQIKDWLIRSNLRLVVSVARKHTRRESELLELISEGNLAVMNAVEKFDYSRGFKFSTYATWAIVKRFATYRTKLSKRSRQIIQAVEQEPLEVAQDLRVEPSMVVAVESARKSLFDVMRDTLEQREQTIVQEHFGLDEQQKVPGLRKAKSLSQIAALVGLSKERVRQIELLALQKLRKVLTPEQFDVITNG